MCFSIEEKREFLRAFTATLSSVKGKGPKNIYIKYYDDEMHIVIQGIISVFEKYLIYNFGQEAIEKLADFYERDINNVEKRFLSILNDNYIFRIYKLESDFLNDCFVYKMKI